MGTVRNIWTPIFGSKDPKPNKIPKYGYNSSLRALMPELDLLEKNHLVNVDYLNYYINGPQTVYVSGATGSTINAIDISDNIIAYNRGSVLQTALVNGTVRGTQTDSSMDMVKMIGGSFVIYPKSKIIIQYDYLLDNKKETQVIPDNENTAITALDVFETTNGEFIMAVGTANGKVGVCKYNAGETITAPISELLQVSSQQITSIAVNASSVIVGLANGTISIYSYDTNGGLTLSGNGDSPVGDDGAPVRFLTFNHNKETIIGGTTSGYIREYNLLNSYISYTNYKNDDMGNAGLVGIETDNVYNNTYLLYTNGTILNLAQGYDGYEIEWSYDLSISGTPTAFAKDSLHHILVAGSTNGQYECITHLHQYLEPEKLETHYLIQNNLLPRVADLTAGKTIEKVEVCQLNGNVTLTGEVLGSLDLTADNSCLLDPDETGEHKHQLVMETTLNDNATIDKVISDTDDKYQVVNKDYVDKLLGVSDALVYKGILEGGTTTASNTIGNTTPAANAGDTYKISTSGYINGKKVEVGDMIICCVDNTPAMDSSLTAEEIEAITNSWNILQNNVDIFNQFNSGLVPTPPTLDNVGLVHKFLRGDSTWGNLIISSTEPDTTNLPNNSIWLKPVN